MAANPASTFDIGPLSWVKAEIEHSLGEARIHLDKIATDPGDTKSINYVATHLHQVTGALSMVGLGAATRFNEEIEKLVETLQNDPNARAVAPQRIAAARKATVALSSYLDILISGETDRPMILAPAYLQVNRARGASDASESDLFAPDLSRSMPIPEDTVALPKSEMLSEAVKQRRGMYQSGLLKLLRDKDMVGGAREMRNATLAIEALQISSPSRSFWYATGGFFDAVAANPAEAGALAVQLFGKIDQQIKLLIEGFQKVPEKLFRDILLVIGKSKAQTERLRKIRELYQLDELLALPDSIAETQADDQLKGVVRALRDQVQTQKDNWLKFAGGNRSTLETYVTQAELLFRTAQQQPNKDITQLIQALGAVGAHLRKIQGPSNETQSLEVATAFLFLESSLENYFRLTAEFSVQASNIVARLKAAMTGAALPAIGGGANALMDDMTKRAQERMLMFQVGQEVQVNLASIEAALDAFFRDAQKTADLATLPPLFSQVQGALTILELDEAAALNQRLRERVAQFASGASKGAGADADAVAEGVSALGLFITALQQGTSNPRDVLQSALIRFGLAQKPVEAENSVVKAHISQSDVDVSKQKVQGLYENWKQRPEQTSTREQLREAVKELKQDAELIADSKSAQQSDMALKAIDATFDPMKTGVSEAISGIAPDKRADVPAAQAIHLIDAPATEVDQELLEIFLEEAREVVATLRENLASVRVSPIDKDALVTIRRGFHTLKGSGRMVGLNDLGNVAWNCEQVMNKWLKEEKPASPGLIGFIERSSIAFNGWIDELQAHGTAHIEGAEIARMAELLKNNREPEFIDLPVAMPAPESVQPAEHAPDIFADEAASEFLPASATKVDSTTGEPGTLPSVAPVVEPPANVEPSTPQVEMPTQTVASSEADLDFFGELPALSPASAPTVAPVPAFDEIRAPQGRVEDHQPQSADAPLEPPEPADVRVGDILVPHSLFYIYLGEADQHIVTLDNEMSEHEAKPRKPVSHDFMRAAHTLTSSSRTTGMETIADVAFALEKWLQDAIEFPPEFDAHRLAVTRSAVDALTSMVSGLHTHEPPNARPDIVLDLTNLREALKQIKRSGEGTFIRMPVAGEAASPATNEYAGVSASAGSVESDAAPMPSTPQVTEAIDFGSFTAEPVPAPAAVTAFVAAQDVGKTSSGQIPTETTSKDRRTMVDDVDLDLLPIFLEEAKEIIPQVGDCLRRWRGAPVNHAPVTELARHLHTLKGSARMAGLMRLGELAHVIESRIITMDQIAEPATNKFDEVDDGVDRFNAAIDQLAGGDFSATSIELPVLSEVSQDLPGPLAVMAATRAEIIAEGEKLDGRERQSMLRVNADTIDRFVNDAGELSIARSRIDQEVLTFKQSLVELTDNINRMKSQLREIEIQAETQIQSRIRDAEEQGEKFDPLEFDRFSRTQELTRFLAESLNDVITLQSSLQKNIDESEAALLQQARLNRDLQQGLMGVRLVPLGNLQDRFYRLLRQTAKELDKKANLKFRGVRVEIDRSVLEKITAPFEHLLRNAVAHGLESPTERVARGKPEVGEITIDAQQVGNEVVLTLADDGNGLDFARIREKAIERGLLDTNADVNEAQLTQFIFMAGFSTAEEVSQIAGRGVGMDVVRNEIVSLGGRIDIASTPGRGTTFTIALPLTLAVTQAVMVIVGGAMYAIPSVMIEQVQEYKGKRYEPFMEMSEVEWKGNKYPLRSMEALLGGRPALSAVRKASVILAKSGQQRAAIQVDSIVGNREIVVKTIGPQLARLAGVAGATMLGSGQIVLIMNPVQLVFRDSTQVALDTPARRDTGTAIAEGAPSATFETTAEPEREVTRGQSLAASIVARESLAGRPAAVAATARTVPLVMVVDDSLTVRKITSRMLTREGFAVATAKDGVDGLQQLQDLEPDMILLDIEMPRMDGFEFARNVRADTRTKNIPIIMITSRTAEKHRNRALELGVNEYMGKPYQEEQLMAMIRRHTRVDDGT